MNTKTRALEGIPAELQEYLGNVPEVSDADRESLRRAIQDLDNDPRFLADVQKGLFVEQMLGALDERGESQSDLAKRLGKSRQYLSKLLNEDKRVNFTIETMCEVAHHLGRRLEILVLRPHEVATVASCLTSNWEVLPRREHSVERTVEAGSKGLSSPQMLSSEFGSAAFFNFGATPLANESSCLAA
ncbi:MAG: helix-turn-helix domain-containing protein [Verrucomicrobiota bacterium]|jgi:transcriptional regulator with XRE-family HTH domain